MKSRDLNYKCNNCGRENKLSKELFERKQTPFCRMCFSTDIICTDEHGKIWRIDHNANKN
jgi:DNA-directed RNA polymerase subunit RPC12/RpoP